MRKLKVSVMALCLLVNAFTPAWAQTPGALGPETSWQEVLQVERCVSVILSKMTLEEKIDILGGVDDFFIRGFPRLGIPRMKMADGPLGVRNFGPATAMAGGIALAATWNTELARRVGTELGRDARAKGVRRAEHREPRGR